MISALIAALIALRDSGKLRWFDGMQYVEPSRRCRRPTCEKHRDLPSLTRKTRIETATVELRQP